MSQVIRQGGGTQPARLLVVDDEAFVREAIELYFVTEGFDVFSASGGPEALELFAKESIDLAILDIVMPGMDGIELLRAMKKSHPDIEVVMASGCGTLDTAIEAMRLGAYDYVTKPILNFDEDLLKVVNKALERRRLLSANRKLARDLQDINKELKGTNAKLKRRVADLEILCENGRMLGDLGALPALLEVVEGTLVHQLNVQCSMILLDTAQGWQLQRAPGFERPGASPPLTERPAFLESESLSLDSVPIVVSHEPWLTDLVMHVGEASDSSSHALLVPLRAAGALVGVLIAFHGESSALSEESQRLLRLLAGQISAPLALCREEVTQ